MVSYKALNTNILHLELIHNHSHPLSYNTAFSIHVRVRILFDPYKDKIDTNIIN